MSAESVAIIWALAGFAAWAWIMCRNNMAESLGDWLVALMMIFPAVVGGPLTWIAVAVSERDGVIK